MLVKCVKNKLSSLDKSQIARHISEHVHQDTIGFTIGVTYQVYGIIFRSGIPWFLLCENISDDYPIPVCYAFFELIDGSINSDWNITLSHCNVSNVSILPKKWAEDHYFMEKLVDGDTDAIMYFNNIKSKN